MFFRKPKWIKGIALALSILLLFQTMPSFNNMHHSWKSLLGYFLGVVLVAGSALAIYWMSHQIKSRQFGMTGRQIAVVCSLAVINLAAIGYLFSVGSFQVVKGAANNNNIYVVSNDSILYYTKIDHFTVMNSDRKVLYDSSSNSVSFTQAINAFQGSNVIVDADVTGNVDLLHTDSDVLTGASVDFTIPTLNYKGKMTEVSPGIYQYHAKETITLTPQNPLNFNDLFAWKINNLGVTYNGTQRNQFTTINQVPAADLFSSATTTSTNSTSSQSSTKSYTLPFNVSISGQLVKNNSPITNAQIAAQVSLQNAGYSETLKLDTDQKGAFTYNRNENVQLNISGGSLKTLSQPVKVDSSQVTAASSVVEFWWGDGGGTNSTSSDQIQNNTGTPRDQNAMVGEPINVTTGNMYSSHTDLAEKGNGLYLAFTRSYNSQSDNGHQSGDTTSQNFPIGYGWEYNYQSHIEVSSDGNTVTKIGGDGGKIQFTKNFLGQFDSQKGKQEYSLVQNADGTYTVRHKSGMEYHYNTNNLLDQISDSNGNRVNISYDSNNLPINITDEYGRKLLIQYNDNGQISSVTDPENHTIQYFYNGIDLVKVVDQTNQSTSYEYDQNHNLTKITDPSGKITTFTYDDQGRATSSSFNDGAYQTNLNYEPDNQQTTVTNSKGQSTVYHYEFIHNIGVVTKIVDPEGHTQSFDWNDDADKVASTNANGNTTRMSYDSKGNVLTITDALGHETDYTYEPKFSRPIKIKDPTGNTNSLSYDGKGNLIKFTDPFGNSTQLSYDSNGRLVKVTNPKGDTTQFQYDSYGNPVKQIDALGYQSNSSFDLLGNLKTLTDLKGNTYQFSYNAKNQLIQSTDPMGNVSKKEYSPTGTLLKMVDPLGRNENYSYDLVGHLTELTDPLNHAKQFTYDSEGNITTFTDQLGRKVIMDYDQLNRPIKATLPDGHTVTFAYDSVGNLVSQTNTAGQTTTYQYDALNRLTAVVDPLGHSTRYQYDALGHLVKATDANGNSTSYRYDALGNLTYATDANKNATKFSYDSIGNLIQKTDANGNITTYSYDVLGRVVAIQYADGKKTNFTYDAMGNQITMGDQQGTTKYEYDSLGRKTKEIEPDGISFCLSYDSVGNITNLTDPLGRSTQYQYDNGNRLTGITDPNGGASTYSYDDVNRLIKSVSPNGTYTQYNYNNLDQLTKLMNYSPNGSLLNSFGYAYDALGNRTSVTDENGKVTNYQYDQLNQLIEADYPSGLKQSYGYDAVGNRTGMTTVGKDSQSQTVQYQYDPANRLTQANDQSYTYDNNGNLISTTQSNKNMVSYSYNGANQLSQVTDDKNTKATYTYDGLGRRVTETVGGKTTRYLYLDDTHVLMEIDENGNAKDTNKSNSSQPNHIISGADQIKENVFGVQGIVANYKINPDGKITGDNNYYQYDGLGSVINLTGKNGDVQARYAYDAFGNQLMPSDPLKKDNVYGFTGQQFDNETGLYYYGARYYDPTVGRFTSKDPFAGSLNNPQSLNPYPYVLNNPVNLIDPDGRMARGIIVDVAIFAAIVIIPEVAGPFLMDMLLAEELSAGAMLTEEVGIAEESSLAGESALTEEGTIAEDGNIYNDKPYSNSRPSYGKGQVEKVWENAKDVDGKVYDPNTGEELTWDKNQSRAGQWDMGHTPENKYSEWHEKYMNGEISKEEFMDWYRNPNNYRPESPSANRSHKFE